MIDPQAFQTHMLDTGRIDLFGKFHSRTIIGGVARLTHTSTLVLSICRSAFNTSGILIRPFTSRLIMNTHMFSPRQYHKIFNPIIRFVVIDMMHYLMGQKIPAKMSFHYKAVLFNMLVRCLRMIRLIFKDVPFTITNYSSLPSGAIFTTHIFSSTSSRAKLLRMRLIIPKFFTALLTNIASFSSDVITSTTAETSLLTRRCVEFLSTIFTDINHTIIITVTMYRGNT